MLLETLIALERSLHAEKRKDAGWLDAILQADFQEITRSGTAVSRAETLSALINDPVHQPIAGTDYQLVTVAPGHALLHYRSDNQNGTRSTLRTSYWVMNDASRWQLFFHQGTPAAEC